MYRRGIAVILTLAAVACGKMESVRKAEEKSQASFATTVTIKLTSGDCASTTDFQQYIQNAGLTPTGAFRACLACLQVSGNGLNQAYCNSLVSGSGGPKPVPGPQPFPIPPPPPQPTLPVPAPIPTITRTVPPGSSGGGITFKCPRGTPNIRPVDPTNPPVPSQPLTGQQNGQLCANVALQAPMTVSGYQYYNFYVSEYYRDVYFCCQYVTGGRDPGASECADTARACLVVEDRGGIFRTTYDIHLTPECSAFKTENPSLNACFPPEPQK